MRRAQISRASLAIAACVGSLLVVWVGYLYTDTIIEVPERPQPGWGPPPPLPDSQFALVAISFAELTQSFEFNTAKMQFKKARRLLWKDGLERYNQEMMKLQLQKIEADHLSQKFEIDPQATTIVRHPELDRVEVTLRGKVSGAQECASATMSLKLTTVPRNVNNEYGIVIDEYQWSCVVNSADLNSS